MFARKTEKRREIGVRKCPLILIFVYFKGITVDETVLKYFKGGDNALTINQALSVVQ